MKISYVVVQQTQQGKANTFLTIPVNIEGCCLDSLVWFFKFQFDFNVQESCLIKRDVATQTVELFPYCQFCGERHQAIKIEKKEQLKENK